MGVGAALGLSLDKISNTSFYIPDVINSARLKKNIINNKWKTNKFSHPVNLIEYWEINEEGFFSNLFSKTLEIVENEL